MSDGNLLSDELLAPLLDAVFRDKRNHRTTTEAAEEPRRRLTSRFPTHAVILDETLNAPLSFLAEPTGSIDPAEPNATVCAWSKEDEKYTQTERRLAVSNHSTTDHAKDTPGAAIFINGHYWFFGDCDPMTSRPVPPWSV